MIRSETTIFRPDRVLPPEVENVNDFVTNCIQNEFNAGLSILGTQGGFIFLPPRIDSNPESYVDLGLKVPHWTYRGEDRIPSLPIMEAHLERHLLENVVSCFDELGTFDDQLDIVRKGDLETFVTIGDAAVVAQVDFPLEISTKNGEKVSDLTNFVVESQIRLKELYLIGRDVMDYQNEVYKTEELAIDLISLNDDTPISGVDFSCSPNLWSVTDVEDTVFRMLRKNLPEVRIANTEFTPIPEDQEYMANHYVWPATEREADGISAFLQLGPQFLMNVRPRDGDSMRSSVSQGAGLAGFVCVQPYKFTYDLRFPVIVTLEDIEHNYNFQFGYYATVKQNYPLTEPVGEPNFQLPTEHISDEDYCFSFRPNTLRVNTFDNVSDPEFGDSFETIAPVNVSFTCLKYTCPLGTSEYFDAGASAYVEDAVPHCTNAFIRAEAPGYLPREVFTPVVDDTTVSLFLTPIRDFDQFTVVKHILNDDGTVGAARPLDADEQAIISIEYRVNGSLEHQTFGTFPSPEFAEPMQFRAVVQIPYDVKIFVSDDDGELTGAYEATWEPSWEELKFGRSIEFHAVGLDAAVTDAEFLTFISTLKNSSAEVPFPEVIQ